MGHQPPAKPRAHNNRGLHGSYEGVGTSKVAAQASSKSLGQSLATDAGAAQKHQQVLARATGAAHLVSVLTAPACCYVISRAAIRRCGAKYARAGGFSRGSRVGDWVLNTSSYMQALPSARSHQHCHCHRGHTGMGSTAAATLDCWAATPTTCTCVCLTHGTCTCSTWHCHVQAAVSSLAGSRCGTMEWLQ
jgi:hypothetical protein